MNNEKDERAGERERERKRESERDRKCCDYVF